MVDGRTLPSATLDLPYPQFTLVRPNGSGKYTSCGANDVDAVGFTARDTFTSDSKVALILLSKQGTITARAAGAIAAGEEVFNAAGGKLANSGTIRRGVAVTAATEDEDWFDFVPTSN